MANQTITDHVGELSGIITASRAELNKSGSYYDASYRLKSIGVAVPPQMRKLSTSIGWPRMYVDSIEERLDIEGFRLAGSSSNIDRLHEWWQYNGLDEESGLGHVDALTYGRSYITIAAPGIEDDSDYPIIQAESPLTMYADVDPRTRNVTRALRVYRDAEYPDRDAATLYLPNSTVHLRSWSSQWVVSDHIEHGLGIVPVVPLVNRARLADRDGASEITPEIRGITDAAGRVMMVMQAAAELMGFPQRLLIGIEADGVGSLSELAELYLSKIIATENDNASAVQFSAAELANFTTALQELAKHIASYTGLPPQYLSFSSDNPASAEAIRSAESRLIKKCERKARMFGGSWEKAMRIAVKIMDGEIPADYHRLETVWRDPATPTYSAKADAIAKLYANGAGVIPKERARLDMGYSSEERAEMKEWDQEDPVNALGSFMQNSQASIPQQRNSDQQQPQTAGSPR